MQRSLMLVLILHVVRPRPMRLKQGIPQVLKTVRLSRDEAQHLFIVARSKRMTESDVLRALITQAYDEYKGQERVDNDKFDFGRITDR